MPRPSTADAIGGSRKALLVPATSKAPEAWSAADKLVAVIHCSPRMSDQKELQLQN
jgi:hypothetical protein